MASTLACNTYAFLRGFQRCGFIFIALLLLSALLSACSSSLLNRQTPPLSTYLLEWNNALAAHSNPQAPSIRLGSIAAAAGFDGPQIIYIRTPYRLEHYAYHRWADSPSRMLEPLLMRMLEGSGLFSAVLGPDSPARAGLQLNAELLYLQQVFNQDGSEVQLALNVSLVDVSRAQQIASKRFTIVEPVTEPTPYGSVQAANRATARLLAALQDFLDQLKPFSVKGIQGDELSIPRAQRRAPAPTLAWVAAKHPDRNDAIAAAYATGA